MKTLHDYENMTVERKCRFCGGLLGAIETYPHEGGYDVEGYPEKQWLYRTCLNINCGHQWSLVHLGIER